MRNCDVLNIKLKIQVYYGTNVWVTYLEIELKDLCQKGFLILLTYQVYMFCVEYIKGKQTKPKRSGAYRATEVLEMIYTDICGSFPIPLWNGQ